MNGSTASPRSRPHAHEAPTAGIGPEPAGNGLCVPSMAQAVRRALDHAAANPSHRGISALPEEREQFTQFVPNTREKYAFVQEIGRGGMGRVWAMTDHDLGRVVAIKSLEDGLDALPEEVGRFVQEAQITGQLEHPNIVPVYELGCTESGQLYFAMKRVRGISLGEILFRLRHGDESIVATYGLPALLRILLKVCDAVAYAHDRGVVHRDLKPDNIMVGRFGEVLVMDWGVAKVLPPEALDSPDDADHATEAAPGTGVPANRQPATRIVVTDREITDRFEPPLPVTSRAGEAGRALTLKGTVVGTPAYMAPEQGRGNLEGSADPVSPRSDIYSLGAILYEMLTLEPPYTADDPVLVVRQLLDGPPPSVRQRASALGRPLPTELCAIVETAMARDPQQRYPSALAFAADVQAFLEGQPVSVHRDSALRRLRKWVRRQPAMAVGLASVTLLALVTSLLGWVTLADRAQMERTRLEYLERQLESERERNRLIKRDELRRQLPRDIEAVPVAHLSQLVPVCTQILNLDPEHVDTRVDRGIAYWRLGQLNEARADLDRALAIEPTTERGNYYRALIAERSGQPAVALLHVERAIRANPLLFPRHVIRLRLLAALGRFAEVQASLDRLLRDFQRLRDRLVKLRVRYYEAQMAREPVALPRLGLADGDEPRSALDRGYALLIEGRYQAAQAVLLDAPRDESPIAVWYGLACCEAHLRPPRQAFRTLYVAWDNGLADSPHDVLSLDPDLEPLRQLPEFAELASSGSADE